MIKKLPLVFSVISFIGCSTHNQSNSIDSNKIDNSKVIGIWTDGQSENATFQIDKDSIFYVDNSQIFKYVIHGDSLRIKFDGFDDISKIEKVDNDSLILTKNGDRQKFWRFKN